MAYSFTCGSIRRRFADPWRIAAPPLCHLKSAHTSMFSSAARAACLTNIEAQRTQALQSGYLRNHVACKKRNLCGVLAPHSGLPTSPSALDKHAQ